MLLPQSTYLSEGVADFLIPYEHKLIVLNPVNIFVKGGGEKWFLVKISWCYYPVQHVSEGVADFWSLAKISWRYYHSQHICQRGGGLWSVMKIWYDIIWYDDDDGDGQNLNYWLRRLPGYHPNSGELLFAPLINKLGINLRIIKPANSAHVNNVV